MLDDALKTEILTFRYLLQRWAHFDEAHCVRTALESPGLCSTDYIRSGLRRAGAVAAMAGFSEVAHWISHLIGS